MEAALVEAGSDLVQREEALQRKRITAHEARAPMLRAYYGLEYDNVLDLDGTKTPWAIFDRALKETSKAISQRLEYYRRTADDKAAKICGMCFTPQRIVTSESPWRQYCPVVLTLNNELVPCRDIRCAVEYKSKVYWISSPEFTSLFTEDPESFLQVPLPTATPNLLHVYERRSGPTCQLEDYCPVALVDKKELVKASGQHIVHYQGKYWSVDGKEAKTKFLRRPMRYITRAKLPPKKPPLPGQHSVQLLKSLTNCSDGKGLDPSEMLTYMQASVAETICQALVESGEQRPLCPGKTAHESALMFLARFLRARNSLNTELHDAAIKESYEAFLKDCALPQDLKDATERKKKQEADWTGYDSRRYKQLASRFDQIFKP
jgi:YHS domain-containing protein